MSSDDKKIWKRPELVSFASAGEAVAYYSQHSLPDHVAAIQRLAREAVGRRQDPSIIPAQVSGRGTEPGYVTSRLATFVPQINDRNLNEIARRSRAELTHRAQIFGVNVAHGLPWNILLILYTDNKRARLTATSLCAEVGAPQTTVLRWLRALETKGYIYREQHPTDRRIAHVVLSDEGRQTLDHYFEMLMAVDKVAV